MHFEPSLDVEQLPAMLSRAVQIGTPAAWASRVESCARQTTENPLIADYLQERFGIEQAMEQVLRYRRATGRIPDIKSTGPSMHRLFAFVVMLAQVHQRLSPRAQNALAGRVRGGLTDDVGLASIAFELRTASHLMRQGVDVEWHDLESGGGYDFLARHGDLEAEIECKTFSGDVGRKIHLRRQYQLGGRLYRALAAALESRGSTFVDVTIPARLSGAEIPATAKLIEEALETGADLAGPNPCTVLVRPLDTKGAPFVRDPYPSPVDQDEIADFIRAAFGCERRLFLLMLSKSRGAALVAFSSRQTDAVLDGIYRQLSSGAAQLSGARPGVICANLLDVSPAELAEIHAAPQATNRPTGLHLMMRKFFDSPARKHVHTAKFTVPGSVQRQSQIDGNILRTHSSEQAPSFVLVNNSHPLSSDSRMKVF